MKKNRYALIILASLISSSYLMAQRRIRKHTTLSSSGTSTVKADRTPPGTSEVNISKDGQYIVIKSNGIPNHSVGSFPNSGNPHEIESQNNEYRVTVNPSMNTSVTKLEIAFDFGVALNGVPFDPGAAEWYKGERNSKWQYEALSGAVRLGVDENYAHVQATGAYHYHGLPTQLLTKLGNIKGKMSPKVGYAADGFSIYALYGKSGKEMTSSYKLKKGMRAIGGRYDGTFVADYEYVEGSGDLDICNGIMLDGKYTYFLTKDFPVIPRCFRGTPDPSFRRSRPSSHKHSSHSDHHRN